MGYQKSDKIQIMCSCSDDFFFYVDSGIFSTMDEKGLAGLDIGVMGVSHQSYKA